MNVTIPAGAQTIGSYAFGYSYGLTGAYFQGNRPSDSGDSFYPDSHAVVYYLPWTTGWGTTYGSAPTALYLPAVPFNYTTNNGAITITGYTGSDGVVSIPASIYLGGGSYSQPPGLPNFLPVTCIGTNAFSGCSSLLTVVIPGGVTNLGSHAFSDCSNLISVFFAGNAPGADATAFSNDDNVLVYCLPGTTGWSSTLAGVPTVQLPYLYTITNGTIAISSYTGSGGAVAIPGMVGGLPVASIGNGAFAFCGGLTSVTMPDSVTDFGIFTFYACSNLTVATLSTNIQNIGVSAFDSCTSLTNVNIPNNVAIIGNSAFQNCVSLGSVIIPDGVNSIGGFAFQNCASLASVAIPASVKDISPSPSIVVKGIGPDPFGACGSLTAISVDPQNTNYSSLDGVLFDLQQSTLIQYPGGKAGDYTVPGSVTSIGNFAFDSCAGLTDLVISNISTYIGDWTFTSLPKLASVTIVNTLITIGVYAFESCSSLKSVNISISSSNIGGYHAFDGCASLTDVTIYNLVSVPLSLYRLFPDCPNLTSIYLRGNSPSFVWNPTNAVAMPTAYYLPGAVTNYITGLPTALWLPRMLNGDVSFGTQTNQFGFNINWAGGTTVVVEACPDLANPVWTPLGTNIIAGTPASGSVYFSDPQWTNYPGRFYRIHGLNGSQQ